MNLQIALGGAGCCLARRVVGYRAEPNQANQHSALVVWWRCAQSSPRRGKEGFAMKSRYLRTVLLLLAACAAAFGNTLVVPTAQATTAGNMPIHLGTGAVRIQEVIGSGQFTGAITIIALRVRAAPGTGSMSSTSGSFS